MTIIERYLKSAKRGEFNWYVLEAGEFGESNSIDLEEVALKGRIGKIRRYGSKEYEAEVDLLDEPFCDCKLFTSRLNARKWCERSIMKDIGI